MTVVVVSFVLGVVAAVVLRSKIGAASDILVLLRLAVIPRRRPLRPVALKSVVKPAMKAKAAS